MAALEYVFSTDSPNHGSGLEQLSFWHMPQDVRDWRQDHPLPDIVTPDYLLKAPRGVTTVMRAIGHATLAQNLRIGEPQMGGQANDEVTRVMAAIRPGFIQVDRGYTEFQDNDETQAYVIPLFTEQGNIELIVHAGFVGFSWRISAEHDLASEYPQLCRAVCDTVEGSGRLESGRKVQVTSQTLETVERAHGFNAQTVGNKLETFLARLVDSMGVRIFPGSLSTPWLIDSHYGSFTIASEDATIFMNISHGFSTGIRRVDMQAYHQNAQATALTREAHELQQELSPLFNL